MHRLLFVALAACGHSGGKLRVGAVAPPGSAGSSASVTRLDACADPESELTMPEGDVTTIDPAGVVRALDGHRGELRRCYERYLKREARGGRITAVLAVRDDGTVSQVQVRGFAPPLNRCLCNVVAKVQFPAPNATAIVAYPMQFSSSL